MKMRRRTSNDDVNRGANRRTAATRVQRRRQPRREPQNHLEAIQERHGHVALEPFARGLALRRRHDARREEVRVGVAGDGAADALGLLHRREVRLLEADARNALVAKRAADDDDVGAGAGDEPCDGAAEAVGAADDDDAFAGEHVALAEVDGRDVQIGSGLAGQR